MPPRLQTWCLAIALLVGSQSTLLLPPARALIFSFTGDPSYNTNPPTGTLTNSGWQWQGTWKTATGTPIAPQFFISAKHLGGNVGDTFLFNGVTYTTIAQNQSSTSDLIVWQVSGTFPTYAPLYVRSDEVDRSAVLYGRGVTRGAAVSVTGLGEDAVRGWLWNSTATAGTLRWGENVIVDAHDFPANPPFPPNGDLLVMEFNRSNGSNTNECTLASWDSGGGLFLRDPVDNLWKLAGVNVDSEYAYRYTSAGSTFFASIFDIGGLFYDESGDTVGPAGNDPFIYATNGTTDLPSHLYSVRISANIAWIRSIAGVPQVNAAPQFSAIGAQVADEGIPYSLQLFATDTNVPAQALTFSRVSGPAGLTVTAGGLVQWTPGESQGGTAPTVLVAVTDNGFPVLSATNSFQITVREDNQPPVPMSVPSQTIRPLIPFSYTLTAVDPDEPANVLTHSLVSGPSGLILSASGLLQWTPTAAQSGLSHTVAARVQDNGSPVRSATNTFQIHVILENHPPVPTPVTGQSADELIPYSIQLSASDPDQSPGTLVHSLVGGPAGLSVSASGLVQWVPSQTQGGATHTVQVLVTDGGSPSLSVTNQFDIVVRDVPQLERTVWQIGIDSPTGTAVSTQQAEFSVQNNINDLRPGRVTRLPEDPEYPGVSLNPTADDDFYFAGVYPTGFNLLPGTLRVPFDEPSTAWERAHTLGDRTNRMHFLLGAVQSAPATVLRLTLDLPSGGSSTNGVNISGFSEHDYVVRFRNGTGLTTQVFSNRLTRATNIVLEFTGAQVGATPGANSIEMVRTGPALPGVSYWLTYDHVRLEVVSNNLAPQINAIADQSVDESIPLTLNLTATDPDNSPGGLTFSLVSGPPGLTVSAGGQVNFVPGPNLGTQTYLTVVRVTDAGIPSQSGTNQFQIQVRNVPQLDRNVWQLGVDSPGTNSLGVQWGEFSPQNNINDLRPGSVTRIAGDPIFDANPAANPGPDDDYYFGGVYRAGFNLLPSLLRVPNDEPFTAWERAHTLGDRTNRMHFVLGTAQSSPTTGFRLTVDLPAGNMVVNGVKQPGIGDHDIVVAFRNGQGQGTVLFSNRVSQATNLVITFPASLVAATYGGNTIEVVRTGPAAPLTSYWIAYDHVRLEVVAGGVGGTSIRNVASRSLLPYSGAPGRTLSGGRISLNGRDHLTISYTRPEPAPEGVSYIVEASTDLLHWFAVETAPVAEDLAGEWRTITVRDISALEDGAARFLRVRTQDSHSGAPIPEF